MKPPFYSCLLVLGLTTLCQAKPLPNEGGLAPASAPALAKEANANRDPLEASESRNNRQLEGIHYPAPLGHFFGRPRRPPPRPESRHRRPPLKSRYRPIYPLPSGNPKAPHGGKHGKEAIHGGGGYGHEVHSGGYGLDDHKGGHKVEVHHGYGHEAHGHKGGGYGHDDHKGGYGHETHTGYGTIEHHGYKEPPKHIKAAPYYGPKYSPYELIAKGKAKKSKKTKYGDDPVKESKTGGYGPTKHDKPISHFGGFGGGGSVKYHKGGYGHDKHQGYGHDKHQGYGHDKHQGYGHDKHQGYGQSKGHKTISHGYDDHKSHGNIHTEHVVVEHEITDKHKGYHGDPHIEYGGHVEYVVSDDHKKDPIHLKDPHNTYDVHAESSSIRSHNDPMPPLPKKPANVDVEHMLLSDPYKTRAAESKSAREDSIPPTVVKMEPVNKGQI